MNEFVLIWSEIDHKLILANRVQYSVKILGAGRTSDWARRNRESADQFKNKEQEEPDRYLCEHQIL